MLMKTASLKKKERMSMNITSEELLKEARALEPQLQQWRRTLHRHPEVGFDLPHTKELVKKAQIGRAHV